VSGDYGFTVRRASGMGRCSCRRWGGEIVVEHDPALELRELVDQGLLDRPARPGQRSEALRADLHNGVDRDRLNGSHEGLHERERDIAAGGSLYDAGHRWEELRNF
jgi:hypothetical protein